MTFRFCVSIDFSDQRLYPSIRIVWDVSDGRTYFRWAVSLHLIVKFAPGQSGIPIRTLALDQLPPIRYPWIQFQTFDLWAIDRAIHRRRQWKILGNHGKVIHRSHFLFIPARHGFTRRCSVSWDPSSGGHRTPGRRAGDGLAFTVTPLVCAHAQKCACAGASSVGELWWTPWTRALRWNAQPLRLSGRLGPMDCYVIRLVCRSGKHCNWQLHPHYSCNVRNSDTGWCNSWHGMCLPPKLMQQIIEAWLFILSLICHNKGWKLLSPGLFCFQKCHISCNGLHIFRYHSTQSAGVEVLIVFVHVGTYLTFIVFRAFYSQRIRFIFIKF